MDEEPAPPEPRSRSLLDAWRAHRFYGAAVGYLVAAWIVLQMAAIVLPGFGATTRALRALMIVLALGLGMTLLAVWSRDRRARSLPLVPRTPHTRLAWALTAILPAALVTTFFLLRPLPRPAADNNKAPAASAAPEKSIAVLPFDNLSDDKANGFFTDGVQDEILTDLARVADLRVVSRSSVMQCRGNTVRNLSEIAAQLGVVHIVEGSVQRAGNEVRVNAQLIDARTKAHEWAMNYDKTLDNVFTVQTEVAQAIAEQLRARISPEEHVAMTTVPTRDALALQLYQQAKELDLHEADTDSRENLLLAVSLLEQAIQRDPGFLSAYCLLSRVHLDLYWSGFDHTDSRRETGRTALDAARVGPDAGETHLAQALYSARSSPWCPTSNAATSGRSKRSTPPSWPPANQGNWKAAPASASSPPWRPTTRPRRRAR